LYHNRLMFTGNPSGIQRVALVQAVLAPIAALIGAVFGGIEAGLSLLYGALVAFAVSSVLVWRERQSMRHPEWDQHRLFKVFIRAGIERLLVLVSLLVVGIVVLNLAPLSLLLGLLLAQFAWVAAATSRNNKQKQPT
jgi:ATP synthase protein I